MESGEFEINPKLSPDSFEFKTPKGAEVIDLR